MKISIKGMGRLGLLIMLLAVVLPMTEPFAQGEPAAAAAAAPAKATPKSKSLWDLIAGGGIFMIPLGMLSVAGLTLTIRNLLVLKRDKLMRPDLLPQLRIMAAEANIQGMAELCQANPSFMTAVVKGGLERVTGDELNVDSVKEGMELTGKYLTTAAIKWVNWLSNIAGVAPMLGLLGTVQGMIFAFANLATTQAGAAQQQMLAVNIAQALYTTAGGLIAAIPALGFYFYFRNQSTRIILGMEILTTDLVKSLRNVEVVAE